MPYDPKRPRPTVEDDAPAPVEALLDTGVHPVVTAADPAPEVDDLRVSPVTTASDVRVVPAPEDSTANRAVMFAAMAAAVVSLVALLLLRRRWR